MSMAIRFKGKVFTFTQPDGSQVKLRGSGNQYHAVFETLDGYTVTKNSQTGFFEIAQLTPDGLGLEPAIDLAAPLNGPAAGVQPGLRVRAEAARAAAQASTLAVGGRRCEERRQERRQQFRALRVAAAAGGPLLAPPQRQTVGDFVGLCLLVDFSDEPATIERDEVDRFCNQQGYDGFGNNGSVRDFFFDNSLGRCRYTNIVAPYYRASRPKTYYTNSQINQPLRAYELINEAIAHLRANGFDFTRLTVDAQGFIYALNFYYAGGVTNNWAEGLWPHSYHLANPVTVAPGRKLYDYQFTAIGDELELGTFCHENGHMLCDYPDLYDDDRNAQSSGVGSYCLMSGGNNANEKNPIAISAYLKRLSGWARNVTPLEHGQTVTLQAGSNDFAIFSRGGREYFLLENRQQTGRDASLPDAGLAIWHIDEDGDNSREQMTPDSHYELSLEQADGLFELERSPSENGDGSDLYDGPSASFGDNTVPSSKWWNGTSSNLRIDQISASGPNMTFRALLGAAVPPANPLSPVSTPNRDIPDNNSVGITDTINVAQAVAIAGIKVRVDISHPFRGDLRVMLSPPGGSQIELHPKGRGANADDLTLTFDEALIPALATLRGRSAQGAWTLTVQDLAAADTGKLKSWGLEISPAPAVSSPVDLQEQTGTPIPDFPNPGIERSLATAANLTVGSVEVSVDITHSWSGDLDLRLVSPSGAEVLLQAGQGGDADNLVRTFTTSTSPALATLQGQATEGTWRLRIKDTASQDVGKLNSWRLLIKP
jgi:M6 family metalloprotease-like protein